MNMNQKICVITTSRSEYGLLYWLMKEIQADPDLELQIIVSGMHLSHEFGLTYKRIEQDGFEIAEKIEMLLSSDTSVGITKSIGLGVIGFADAFERIKPNAVIVLGDRFETLAAAQAAFIAKIPLIHIHGGELTQGAYDDGIRHSITKMSHLHFVATETYRNRVIQLGEQPSSVFCVGAMVLDSIKHIKLKTKIELESALGLTFKRQSILVTYHPETLSSMPVQDSFNSLLTVLADKQESTILFTKANADSNGRIINDMIDDFCKMHDNARGFIELGHENYLSLLNQVDLVIGNSSSGIIEAPYFRVPTVNIGNRQLGRYQYESIINCEANSESIEKGITAAVSKEHRNTISSMVLINEQDKIALQIIKIIKKTELTTLLNKKFYDMNFR